MHVTQHTLVDSPSATSNFFVTTHRVLSHKVYLQELHVHIQNIMHQVHVNTDELFLHLGFDREVDFAYHLHTAVAYSNNKHNL